MKKFGKILLYVILLYVALYASYNIFLLLQVLDFYFVLFLVLWFLASLWFVIGIIKPKKLPFFRVTSSRVIVGLIYVGFVYGLFMGVIVMETAYYKRDAMRSLKRNILYLVRFFEDVHPFDGDSYSVKNTQKFVDDSTVPTVEEVQNAEHLPAVHKVTLSEVQEEFPEKEPKHRY